MQDKQQQVVSFGILGRGGFLFEDLTPQSTEDLSVLLIDVAQRRIQPGSPPRFEPGTYLCGWQAC
jgi:hypothetical protein